MVSQLSSRVYKDLINGIQAFCTVEHTPELISSDVHAHLCEVLVTRTRRTPFYGKKLKQDIFGSNYKEFIGHMSNTQKAAFNELEIVDGLVVINGFTASGKTTSAENKVNILADDALFAGYLGQIEENLHGHDQTVEAARIQGDKRKKTMIKTLNLTLEQAMWRELNNSGDDEDGDFKKLLSLLRRIQNQPKLEFKEKAVLKDLLQRLWLLTISKADMKHILMDEGAKTGSGFLITVVAKHPKLDFLIVEGDKVQQTPYTRTYLNPEFPNAFSRVLKGSALRIAMQLTSHDACLVHQRRMWTQDICVFLSVHYYSGKLRDGNEKKKKPIEFEVCNTFITDTLNVATKGDTRVNASPFKTVQGIGRNVVIVDFTGSNRLTDFADDTRDNLVALSRHNHALFVICNSKSTSPNSYADNAKRAIQLKGVGRNICSLAGFASGLSALIEIPAPELGSCFKCNGVGHKAKECTIITTFVPKCHNCNGAHDYDDCPDGYTSINNVIRKRCHEIGHKAAKCGAPWCPKCRVLGHDKEGCPQKLCIKCKATSHWHGEKCPQFVNCRRGKTRATLSKVAVSNTIKVSAELDEIYDDLELKSKLSVGQEADGSVVNDGAWGGEANDGGWGNGDDNGGGWNTEADAGAGNLDTSSAWWNLVSNVLTKPIENFNLLYSTENTKQQPSL
ncbi:hypothetical protein BPAE_0021g00550 [Botrytis paeoniae]|uniref:CCHC-type domain-containing protein n=1 Tax=Botrytis paeoniae TaxID=278948 RepID=A0A4Z1G0A6_9HELO|nr:hypothetical protein BPAE_0021g00550 [Botrytis paeoniae]